MTYKIDDLIWLYLNDELPDDVTKILVPPGTFFYQLPGDNWHEPEEEIHLNTFAVKRFGKFTGEKLHVGYGEESKTLVMWPKEPIKVEDLLTLFLNNELPRDIQLDRVSIEFGDFYEGKWRVKPDFPEWLPSDRRPPDIPKADEPFVQKETIEVAEYKINGKIFYAGYGPETKTLIVGKENEAS